MVQVQHENTQRIIEISAEDLPLHCPTPDMIAWDSHPRVFLPVEVKGEALCPYCGTMYVLKGGAAVESCSTLPDIGPTP